jgi:hypothetical protein
LEMCCSVCAIHSLANKTECIPAGSPRIYRKFTFMEHALSFLAYIGRIAALCSFALCGGPRCKLSFHRISLGIRGKAAENGVLSTAPQTREPRRFKLVLASCAKLGRFLGPPSAGWFLATFPPPPNTQKTFLQGDLFWLLGL